MGPEFRWAASGKAQVGLVDPAQPDWNECLVPLPGHGLTSWGGLDSLRDPLVPHLITDPKRVILSQLWIEFCLCLASFLGITDVRIIPFVVCSHPLLLAATQGPTM